MTSTISLDIRPQYGQSKNEIKRGGPAQVVKAFLVSQKMYFYLILYYISEEDILL